MGDAAGQPATASAPVSSPQAAIAASAQHQPMLPVNPPAGALHKGPDPQGLEMVPAHVLAAQAEAGKLNAIEAAKKLSAVQTSALAGEINRRWMDARRAKLVQVDLDLLQDLRQREGIYDPEIEAEIKASGGSQIFDNITEPICQAIAASLSKVLIQQGEDLPWSVEPSALPELPPAALQKIAAKVANHVSEFMAQQQGAQHPDQITPEMQGQLKDSLMGAIDNMESEVAEEVDEEAQTRADKLQKRLEIIFEKGGFVEALSDFLSDFVTYRAAHLLGPIPTFRFTPTWNTTTGRMETNRELVLAMKRVSPFDVFPDASSIQPNDGGMRIRWLFSRKDVEELLPPEGEKNWTGVIVPELRKVLEDWDSIAQGVSTIMSSDAPRAQIELRYNAIQAYHGRAEGIIFWEPIDGKRLNEFYAEQGFPAQAKYDPARSYSVTGIQIRTHIIQLVENFNPTGDIPLHKACYRKRPGAYWGKSPASLMRDEQIPTNSYTRAGLTNASYASKPDRMIDLDRMVNPVVSDIPGQKFYTKHNDGQTIQPVVLLTTPLIATEMSELRDKSTGRAWNKVGVQPYNVGDGSTAANQGTLGSFKMLVDMQSENMKDAIFGIDGFVMRKLVYQTWLWLMIYDPDQSIKGDIHIKARGALELYVKEADAEKRMQWLDRTNNPVDLQVIGVAGRAHQLRKAAHSLGIGTEGIPTEGDMRERAGETPAGQPPAAPQGPTDADKQDALTKASLASARIQRDQADAQLKRSQAIKFQGELAIKKALAMLQISNGGQQQPGLRVSGYGSNPNPQPKQSLATSMS